MNLRFRPFSRYTSILCLLAVVLSPLSAQQAAIDENTRLMQEYMARRAEWVELRRAAFDKIKAAKDEKEKKQHRDKLAEDEKPILAKVGEAARAYRDGENAKRDQLGVSAKPAK